MILLLAIIGGLLNRFRGGWYDRFKYLKNIPHGVWRIVVASFSTFCLYLPLWQEYNFFTIGDCLWLLLVFASFLVLGLTQGWGSWFTIGRTENSYNHNRDWILSEWLAFKVYGAKWIPWSHCGVFPRGDRTLLSRFNCVKSPTSQPRPFEWRRNMELFAMNIRGLNITLPASLFFALHLYFSFDIKAYLLIPLAASGYLFGYIYELGFKFNTSKLPKAFQGNTQLGEFISGATLMSSFLFIGSWVVLNF